MSDIQSDVNDIIKDLTQISSDKYTLKKHIEKFVRDLEDFRKKFDEHRNKADFGDYDKFLEDNLKLVKEVFSNDLVKKVVENWKAVVNKIEPCIKTIDVLRGKLPVNQVDSNFKTLAKQMYSLRDELITSKNNIK